MPSTNHPWKTARPASPFPGQRLRGRMPTTIAKKTGDCVLCTIKVKAGQRVGKHFETDTWVHLGCLVRTINETNRTT